MKKTICLMLTVVLLLFAVSCEEKIDTGALVDYKLNGVEFSLPRFMRRSAVEGYEACFDNLSIYYSVMEVDEEMYSAMGLDYAAGADVYFDKLMSRNGLEKSRVYYEYDEERAIRSFRYSYDESNGEDSSAALFYYVILAGDTDNLWYFEICCAESSSASNINMFNSWRNNINVTEKSK